MVFPRIAYTCRYSSKGQFTPSFPLAFQQKLIVSPLVQQITNTPTLASNEASALTIQSNKPNQVISQAVATITDITVCDIINVSVLRFIYCLFVRVKMSVSPVNNAQTVDEGVSFSIFGCCWV